MRNMYFSINLGIHRKKLRRQEKKQKGQMPSEVSGQTNENHAPITKDHAELKTKNKLISAKSTFSSEESYVKHSSAKGKSKKKKKT